MTRFAGLSLLLLAAQERSGAVAEVLLRDEILCLASQRLDGYTSGETKTTVKYKGNDDIEVRFQDEPVSCGGQDTIVILMNLTVDDVEPAFLYSAITDFESQLEWTPGVKGYEHLPDDAKQGVVGLKMIYSVSPILAERVIYQHMATARDGTGWMDSTDFWFAASSKHTEELQHRDPQQENGFFLGLGKPVVADSCMSTYHVQKLPNGKVHVWSSNNVNGHPEFGLLTPQMVAELSWSKTLEFAQLLKKRAKTLQDAQKAGTTSELTLPSDVSARTDWLEKKRKSTCARTPLSLQILDDTREVGNEQEFLSARLHTNRSWVGFVAASLSACLMWTAGVRAVGLVQRTKRARQNREDVAEEVARLTPLTEDRLVAPLNCEAALARELTTAS